MDGVPPDARLEVRKTYKLYVGGAFARSESGRSYPVVDHAGRFLANAALASRKDARDAVVSARAALPGWSNATAYNRGQVLYRVAEVMQGRSAQFADEVAATEGLPVHRARAIVEATIDRWVWYAGWTDKLAQIAGGANPVAGPYLDLSVPEPVGVVAVLAPAASSLLGLVSVLAPVLVSGNTTVLLASQDRPIPAITLAEVLATGDVPDGVVNILTGRTGEVAPWLASHEGIDALDLTGAAPAPAAPGGRPAPPVPGVDWGQLESAAAQTLTRVRRPPGEGSSEDPAGALEPDWSSEPDGPARALFFTELKTVWHPKGR